MSTAQKSQIPLGLRLRAGDETAFAEVAQALGNTGGNVTESAAELGVNHATLYRALRAHPRLQRELDRLQGRETSLDVLADLLPPGTHKLKIDCRNETGGAALRAAIAGIIE